ncbi:MAG TPA: CHAD domain-containing protein [Microvirga sp.]|nr:CHAD domain-containing protein [Microvirga sp.]
MGSGKNKRPKAAPREIELKLAGDADAVRALARHPILKGAKRAPGAGGTLKATYFDTPEGDLREAGLSVRVRAKGEAWIQTVKAERGERGLVLDRNEWEVPVAGPALDLDAAQGSGLAALLAERPELAARIAPAFTVRTERRAFLIARDGAEIELVLDRAGIAAGRRRIRFGEVELELKAGDPAALFGLARDLAEAAPLRLSLVTKAARGHALLAGGMTPAKADKTALEPGFATAEAFRRVARSCLAQALHNEAALRETGEAGALHQMRVGLRRLRAAVSLFKDLFDDPESERIRAELRWFGHALGPARDLDVLAGRLQDAPEADRAPDHAAQAAAVEERRKAARDALFALLDTPRARLVPLRTAAWIEDGEWLRSNDPAAREEPIEARARHELSRRWKRVLKRGRRLAALEAEPRHELRIEIKKLRYGAEFFAGLFGGRRAKERRRAVLEGLANLQETLGELNDLAVQGHLAADAGGGPAPAADPAPADPQEAPPEGEAAAAEPAGPADGDARVADLIGRAEAEFRRLKEIKLFWA